MKRTAIPLLSLPLLALALLTGGPGSALATGEADPPATAAPAELKVPAGAAGLSVAKDPETGRLMPLPPDQLRELLSRDVRQATSSSHEGLVETAAPGGGVMVDLRGRFQSAFGAEIGPDGKLTTHCGHDGDGGSRTGSQEKRP